MIYVYLIDGVAVPARIWNRRQIFGEHGAAVFTVASYRMQERL